MYLTKIIERFGSYEDVSKTIDEECNKMHAEGYELITYLLVANNEKIMITFRKI